MRYNSTRATVLDRGDNVCARRGGEVYPIAWLSASMNCSRRDSGRVRLEVAKGSVQFAAMAREYSR